MNNSLEIIIGALLLLLIVIAFFAFKSKSKNKYYETKYSKIIDVDGEVKKSKQIKDEIDKDIEDLRASYKDKKFLFLRPGIIFNSLLKISINFINRGSFIWILNVKNITTLEYINFWFK